MDKVHCPNRFNYVLFTGKRQETADQHDIWTHVSNTIIGLMRVKIPMIWSYLSEFLLFNMVKCKWLFPHGKISQMLANWYTLKEEDHLFSKDMQLFLNTQCSAICIPSNKTCTSTYLHITTKERTKKWWVGHWKRI